MAWADTDNPVDQIEVNELSVATGAGGCESVDRANSPHTTYQSNCLRDSTPLQHRHLTVLICSRKQYAATGAGGCESVDRASGRAGPRLPGVDPWTGG